MNWSVQNRWKTTPQALWFKYSKDKKITALFLDSFHAIKDKLGDPIVHTNHGIDFDLNSSVISIVVDMEYLDKLKKELNYDGKYFYTKFLVSKELLNILSMVRVTQDINLMEELVKILIID